MTLQERKQFYDKVMTTSADVCKMSLSIVNSDATEPIQSYLANNNVNLNPTLASINKVKDEIPALSDSTKRMSKKLRNLQETVEILKFENLFNPR
jgi:archaellum component FlaC